MDYFILLKILNGKRKKDIVYTNGIDLLQYFKIKLHILFILSDSSLLLLLLLLLLILLLFLFLLHLLLLFLHASVVPAVVVLHEFPMRLPALTCFPHRF